MIIVAGHVIVDQGHRDTYLADCVAVVTQARDTPGCLDFSLSADLIHSGRINILERWQSRQALRAFRGSGPSDDQKSAIQGADVAEYDVSHDRSNPLRRASSPWRPT